VLVTGGAGFIGSHLADLLLARGDHVTVIDDLSTGRRRNLPASHPRLDFRHEDLGRALASLPPGTRFDHVYHLAAAVGVKLVMDQPIRSMETNIEQTAALLRYVAAAPCPTLIASSSEVYGKSSKSPFHENDDAVYGPTVVGPGSYASATGIARASRLDVGWRSV
jgi:UDP-glucose 4-epimerase